MDAQDVLVESAEIGSIASESEVEKKDLLALFKVFAAALLPYLKDDDVPGLLIGTSLFRNGKDLRSAVVLALGDRVLLGWMKGILKKPVVEVVPLSSIMSAERVTPPQAGSFPKVRSSVVIAAEDRWEILCSPDVADEAPMYRILVELLTGELTADRLPALGR